MKKSNQYCPRFSFSLSVIAMVGCGNSSLKYGVGVVSSFGEIKNADGDANGAGELVTTAVAVLLDKDNKIVAIDLDSAQIKAGWTSEGKVIATEDFRTKYELGKEYGMSKTGKKEWNEQADAFKATVVGKTLDEVKAMMGEDTYAKGDLAAAGCTISVGEFIGALEKAVANAVESDATAKNTLNLAIVSSATNKDATEEAEGSIEISSTIVAAVVDADAKVVVSKTDNVAETISFDAKGVSSTDATAVIKTKLEKGADYGMSAAINYGPQNDPNGDGKVLEWNEQAAAFDAALVGKTASEFGALAGEDGRGTGDLATAGCTIGISEMIATAEKAATVA